VGAVCAVESSLCSFLIFPSVSEGILRYPASLGPSIHRPTHTPLPGAPRCSPLTLKDRPSSPCLGSTPTPSRIFSNSPLWEASPDLHSPLQGHGYSFSNPFPYKDATWSWHHARHALGYPPALTEWLAVSIPSPRDMDPWHQIPTRIAPPEQIPLLYVISHKWMDSKCHEDQVITRVVSCHSPLLAHCSFTLVCSQQICWIAL
jgi:hypothetical protein